MCLSSLNTDHEPVSQARKEVLSKDLSDEETNEATNEAGCTQRPLCKPVPGGPWSRIPLKRKDGYAFLSGMLQLLCSFSKASRYLS